MTKRSSVQSIGVQRLGVRIAGVLLLLAGAAPSKGKAAEPVRVTVETGQLEVRTGQTVDLRLGLLDAAGDSVAADQDLVIKLLVGGEAEAIDVLLREGESEAMLEIEPGSPGLLELRAEHPELRSGGAYLRVKEAQADAEAEAAPPHETPTTFLRMSAQRSVLPPGAAAEERMTADVEPSGEPRLEPIGPSVRDRHLAAAVRRTRATDHVFELPEPEVVELPKTGILPAPTDAATVPKLRIRATPQRNLLADGKDSSYIYAFLEGENPTGFKIHLVPDTGHLKPIPLSLESGQTTATAELTASRPGTVKVEYVGAQPDLEPMDRGFVEVDFEPPITSLEIDVPSEIGVGDTAPIVARLVGPDQNPLRTAREREVTFSVLNGRASLSDDSINIAPGGFEARTSLTSQWWGETEVQAFTPNLRAKSKTVKIVPPWDILALTAIGSLAGGFIAWTYRRAKHEGLWQRLVAGLVAGLVLYWLLLYLGTIPRAAISNPFGVFAAAVVGGWLGTEVFDLAATALGLRSPPGARRAGGAPAGD